MVSTLTLLVAATSILEACLHPPVSSNDVKHGNSDLRMAPVIDALPDENPHDIVLLGRMPFNVSASDIWGYAANGREYAIIGLWDRATIVDVTDPENLEVVIEYPGVNSLWRDMKTLDNYLYISVDANVQGIQIIDLSPLPNEPILVKTFEDVLTTHNIFIDTDRELLYATGSNFPKGEGMRIYSLADPINPQLLSAWTETYVHDVHAVGDRAVAFLGEAGVAVFDVSNPSNPVEIQRFSYPNLSYAHSGWFSPDGRYLAINDEFDELFFAVRRTRIRIFELDPDTDQYFFLSEFIEPTDAVDHNIFWMGDYGYLANYTSGLSILDLSNPHLPLLTAKYDTFHPSNTAILAGAWGVYPFLPSGKILVSDVNSGLYVFQHIPAKDGLTDWDNDGIPDIYETNTGIYNGPTDTGTSPYFADTDGDGLLDGEEIAYGTDPSKPDTDGDGMSDWQEILYGYDPLNPNDFAPMPVSSTTVKVLLTVVLALGGWIGRRRYLNTA